VIAWIVGGLLLGSLTFPGLSLGQQALTCQAERQQIEQLQFQVNAADLSLKHLREVMTRELQEQVEARRRVEAQLAQTQTELAQAKKASLAPAEEK
jgi:phosphoglycerate-specific signal transduction histidine kinase